MKARVFSLLLWWFSMGLALVLLLAACNLPATPTAAPPAPTSSPPSLATPLPSATPSPTTCGDDVNCLINAAQTCTPQEGSLTLMVDMGVQVTTVYHFVVKGMQNDQCAFQVELQSADVTYSDEMRQQMKASGMTDEQIEQQRQQIISQMEDAAVSGECTGSGEDLAALLKRWHDGRYSMDDWDPFTCTGQGFGPSEVEVTVEVTAEIATEAPPSETPTPTVTPEVKLPTPQLVFFEKQAVEENGKVTAYRYWFGFTNWKDFAPALFAPRPDLPACGGNPKAARTRVRVLNADTRQVLVVYCSLQSPEDLKKLGFGWQANLPQPRRLKVEFWDRAANVRVMSNVVDVP